MNFDDTACSIDEVADTSAPGCELVYQWLREYNWTVNEPFMACLEAPENEPRALILLANSGGEVVGGLFAHTQLAWLRISIMAVSPKFRSQGIGGALLLAAEQRAILRSCKHAYVDTMDYQAPEFYEKNGYAVTGRIEDFDSHGHAKLFFVKELKQIAPKG